MLNNSVSQTVQKLALTAFLFYLYSNVVLVLSHEVKQSGYI